MSQKKIDTAAIISAADTISNINNQLTNTLESSRTTVEGLRNVWSGQAADATIQAYRAFETKYSQQYREMLNEYSKFLKDIAAEGYIATENRGTSLADTI